MSKNIEVQESNELTPFDPQSLKSLKLESLQINLSLLTYALSVGTTLTPILG